MGTYFGPAEFSGDLEVSMDLRLEDDGVFTLDFLNAKNKNMNYGTLELDTAGSFKLGKHTGNVKFNSNTWHAISVRNALSWQALTVDGKQLANVTTSASLGGVYGSRSELAPGETPYHYKVGLSRYIFASIDNFKIQHGAAQTQSMLVV